MTNGEVWPKPATRTIPPPKTNNLRRRKKYHTKTHEIKLYLHWINWCNTIFPLEFTDWSPINCFHPNIRWIQFSSSISNGECFTCALEWDVFYVYSIDWIYENWACIGWPHRIWGAVSLAWFVLIGSRCERWSHAIGPRSERGYECSRIRRACVRTSRNFKIADTTVLRSQHLPGKWATIWCLRLWGYYVVFCRFRFSCWMFWNTILCGGIISRCMIYMKNKFGIHIITRDN